VSLRSACLAANERYASSFYKGGLPSVPAKRAVVITCIDARMLPDQILGFDIGDAQYIRNAGALVTDDALRSLILSQLVHATTDFFVVGHTDCALATLDERQLQQRLRDAMGEDASGIVFGVFKDVDANVRAQVEKIAASPFISERVNVHGLVYQVEDGRLREVV
jgi:carbonic anhydrase